MATVFPAPDIPVIITILVSLLAIYHPPYSTYRVNEYLSLLYLISNTYALKCSFLGKKKHRYYHKPVLNKLNNYLVTFIFSFTSSTNFFACSSAILPSSVAVTI